MKNIFFRFLLLFVTVLSLGAPVLANTNVVDAQGNKKEIFIDKSREYPTSLIALYGLGSVSINSFFSNSLDAMVKAARENSYPVLKKMTGAMSAGLGLSYAFFPHNDKARVYGYELGFSFILPETTAYGYIPENDENYTELYHFNSRRILNFSAQFLINIFEEKGVFMYIGLGPVFISESFMLDSEIALQKHSAQFSAIGFGAKFSFQIVYRAFNYGGWLMALEANFLPVFTFSSTDGNYMGKVASEFGNSSSVDLLKPTTTKPDSSLWDHHGMAIKLGYMILF